MWHTPCLSRGKNLPKCKSLVFKSGWLIYFSCWNPTIHCEAYKANLTIDGSIHHHIQWTPRSSNCRLVMWLTYNPCLLLSFAQLHCNFLHLSNRKKGRARPSLLKHNIEKEFHCQKFHLYPFAFHHLLWLQRHWHLQLQWYYHLRLQQQHCHHHMFSLHI